MEIQVAIFDDNASRRDGLEIMINLTEGMHCVGAFPDCSNVIADIDQTKPDIVLMDIDMPKVNGIEGVKLIRQKNSGIKILMQTVFEDDEKKMRKRIKHLCILLRSPSTTPNSTYFNSIFLSFFMNMKKGER